MTKLYRNFVKGIGLSAFVFASMLTPKTTHFVSQAMAQLKVANQASSTYENADMIKAFSKQGIRISKDEVQKIRENILLAIADAKAYGIGNSKVDFAAIEIAQDLELDISAGSNSVKNVVAAIDFLVKHPSPPKPKTPPASWLEYYNKTIGLIYDPTFSQLVQQAGFSPVKISWEDIGRHANSSWGDRISDVGIWVRSDEKDSQSVNLAMSVRRDSNFRDKVLMVPAQKIKIHRQVNGKTEELTLTQRLEELKLASPKRDRNVIVSNQFAVVPVPARNMDGAWKDGEPPRAAFNFSIYPYGSTNYVITDVIEGSSEAIVGPGTHQYLYANVDGKKAPFTASRAEDRQDLLKLEAELKAQGMDVDVQRYYLIQIPIKKDAQKIVLSNLGTPTQKPALNIATEGDSLSISGSSVGTGVSFGLGGLGNTGSGMGGGGYGYGSGSNLQKSAKPKAKGGIPQPTAVAKSESIQDIPSQPSVAAPSAEPMPSADLMVAESAKKEESPKADPTAGLTKVAIGHGEVEGDYFGGSGYENQRADEPIRVTVIYFVTPVGNVTQKDMESFTNAFKAWDSQAIWGGSFVTKESGL